MTKVVISPQFGGFGLSTEGEKLYKDATKNWGVYSRYIPRDDATLVSLVEEHGSEFMSGPHATLKVVEIPDDVEWTIEEYDGNEWVAEKHRTWS